MIPETAAAPQSISQDMRPHHKIGALEKSSVARHGSAVYAAANTARFRRFIENNGEINKFTAEVA